MNAQNDTKYVRKMFAGFLIPSLTASFWLSLSNIVDSLVIGQKMQENGLAAANLVLPIFMVFNVLDVGLATGGAMAYNKLLGEGKLKEARAHFTQIIVSGALISLFFTGCGLFLIRPVLWLLGVSPEQTAVYEMTRDYAQILLIAAPLFFLAMILYEFIRNDNGTVRATVGFVAGGVLDIVLNIVFVLVLEMGVQGAIYATVIGKAVSVLVYIGHFFGKNQILRFRFGKISARSVLRSFRIGFAASNQYVLQFIFLLTANQILIHAHGETGVAVFGLILNVSYVVLSLFEGTISAMQPLVTTFFGEHDRKAAREVLRRSFFTATFTTAALAAMAFIFAPQICGVFGLTDAVSVKYGSEGVRIFLFSAVIAGWNMLYAGYAQASGQEKWCFVLTVMRNLIVLLPCMLVCSLFGSLSVFWWMYLLNESISLLVTVCLMRVRKSALFAEDPDERILRTWISGENSDLAKATAETEAFCEQCEASMKQQYYVTLAVEETCAAIIQNAFEKQKIARSQSYIMITLIALPGGDFELHIRDNALLYNPFDEFTKKLANMDDTEGLNAIGILLVKKKSKSFFYRRYLGFNVLVITV